MDFFDALKPGAVVLTPNRRLSATLHKLFQQRQLDKNNHAWETPDILPLTSWIRRLWDDYCTETVDAHPLVLNPAQEHFLWEKILLSSNEHDHLLQVSETARLAQSAWRLINEWQISLQDTGFDISEDYSAPKRWLLSFEKLCKKNHWLDSAALNRRVIDQISAGIIAPPLAIHLYGFTELTPQIQLLLNKCEMAGSQIHHEAHINHHPVSRRISLPDQEAEIQTLARWARDTSRKHPGKQIGCVIPSLDKIRDRVAQIFTEVFSDHDPLITATEESAFNISAGKSLAQYPVINCALMILSLFKKNIPIVTMSYLLATPFIGEAERERIRRASFDSLLRIQNKLTVSLDSTDTSRALDVTASMENHCPLLAKRLRQYLAALDSIKGPLTYSEWSSQFNRLLTACGWPGERSLNSEEYQVTEAWLEILARMGTLDVVSDPVNISQAWHALQKISMDTVFQPRTPEAAIQVLGILEAAALPFDFLWVTGMDDTAWPEQPRPHPFIPKRIQRELRMPHATAERELTFCKKLLSQYTHSAHDVIFSHAEKNDDLEMLPSPLIRELPCIETDDLDLETFTPVYMRIFQTRQIDIFYDDHAPAVTADEHIRGGVSVIKQQALCPFKSFAEARLHARALESPLPGLRSRDRGSVIHKTMELIWNRLGDQARLIDMGTNDLTALIRYCIDEALNTVPSTHSEFTQYMALEKIRLQKLITGWLELEKSRPPFRVFGNEHKAEFHLGQLNLNIRIDRIDELEDGKKLIIDYKTGRQNDIADWFSERPEEPQLPLYSLLDPEQTCGITFAQVYPGECTFKGVSRYALDMPGIRMITEIKKTDALSWSEQIRQWQATLTRLSSEFCQGDARVDPKDPAQTCNWCDLHSLCRVNEEIRHVEPASSGETQH